MSKTVTPLLNVAAVAASVTFYERLGFAVDQRFEDGGVLQWAALKVGDARLMLNRQSKIAGTERRARPHYGDLVLYVQVPSARAMRDRLQAAGIEVSAVAWQEYGLHECYVRDPDGYEVAIVSEAP